jgi:polar amino acid transport system substrate-binding protein/glutamate/aspartate transport system substrate-binding protein
MARRILRPWAAKKVGVLAGTTTEEDLRRAMTAAKINADIVLMKEHQEGIAAVEKGTLAAYFADRAILTSLLQTGGNPARGLQLADAYLSIEPYALAMRRGDEDFPPRCRYRAEPDLSVGDISKIFAATFGQGRPSPMLLGLYVTSALPQ